MAIAKWIGGFLGWITTGSMLGGLLGFFIGSMLDSASGANSDQQGGDDGSDYGGYGSGQGYGGYSGSYRSDGSRSGYSGSYRSRGNRSSDRFSSGFSGGYSSDDEFRTRQGNRNSFLISMLVLASYIIKADGRIMHSEMEFVRQFLRQNFGSEAVDQGNEILLKLFDEQKHLSPSQIKEAIRKACVDMNLHMDYSTRLQLLNFLVLIALADGTLSPEEVTAIREVGIYLNISREDIDSMLHLNKTVGDEASLDDAYKVLGVSPDATDAEVKAAYRRMALKNHPDRVEALGDDIRKAAEKKFQEINAAKELIWKARGL
ncbi:DnaJ domain-containing protein [Prevotella lacticifex]|uniref:J domain-containing protein n=1 Tax=Prevotella lacticifex TaxID=2854755 RepID=A0A9R1C9L3_9BACT|nr:DnaJ domain-containing protein [Prevotella lacticifex]GJG35276.1 hypothetical protein PRLR5003_04330 [Prevotella lacticifex]GJG39673.1 hypothetical protein PRLR5019_16440 [Prevotella lacticifex]GJG41645.1 hypothetical protein PRLR5025_04310 [Prevotella lacticifex]GJG46029.1 hypothetical protein PRLR5027_16240 [Prevotella lacticifex]GJG47996.1 hypothetical protein PRLR5052_04090 [Prevotella lacticifex]